MNGNRRSRPWTQDILRTAGPALVLLAAVLIYANALEGQFVLDDRVITENPYVNDLALVPHLFTTDYWGPGSASGLYRPLPLVTLALQYSLHGDLAWPFHLLNIALHALTSLLVFLFIEHLAGDRRASLVAALFFAVHPIHTEAVTNITGRSELLAALFALASLLTFRCIKREWKSTTLCGAFFFLALLSKESAALTPAMILLVELYFPAGRPLRRSLVRLLSLSLPLLLYLLMRFHALGSLLDSACAPNFSANPIAHLQGGEALATALFVAARCLWLLIVPVRLSVDYSYGHTKPVGFHEPVALIGLTLLVLLLLLSVLGRRRLPLSAFSAAFFLLTYAMVGNLFFPIGTVMAERLLYLPALAVCAAAGSLVRLAQKGPQLIAVCLLFSAVIIWFALLAHARNAVWRSRVSLAESAVASAPESLAARQLLANVRLSLGRFEEAQDELNEIERIVGRADDRFVPLLERDPRVFRSRNMRGAILLRKGDIEGAEKAFERALLGYPEYPEALSNLGYVRVLLGKPAKALGPLVQALKLKPSSAAAANNLALAYMRPGLTQDLAMAETWALRARALSPESAAIRDTLGDLFALTGRQREARAQYERALDLAQTAEERAAILKKLKRLYSP